MATKRTKKTAKPVVYDTAFMIRRDGDAGWQLYVVRIPQGIKAVEFEPRGQPNLKEIAIGNLKALLYDHLYAGGV